MSRFQFKEATLERPNVASRGQDPGEHLSVAKSRASAQRVRRQLPLAVSALALITAAPALAQTMPSNDGASVPANGQSNQKRNDATDKKADQNQTQPADGVATTDLQAASASAPASGDIIVTGISQSLATAQTIKRNADTVVDAITSQDIGSLPDRSINEALQRVPGVAISRFAAPNDSAHFSVQGSGVTIRGLNYVRSEFNGRDIFSAGSGRGLGFDDVPAELAGTVEVYKNLTADMIEGGIAGTVSVNTRKPFDSDKRVLFLSAGVNGGDLAQKSAPQFVGLFSNQWELGDGSRIGFLLGGSYQKQFSRADSVFLNGFQPRFNAPYDADGYNCSVGKIINPGTPYALRVCDNFPTPSGFSQVYTPLGAGFRSQDFDRERNSINSALQFESADRRLLATATYVRSYFDERWTERTIESDNWFPDAGQIYPAGYLNQLGFPYDPSANFNYDDRGVFTSGTLVHSGYYPYGCTPQADANCNYTQFVPGGITTKLSNRNVYNQVKTQDAALNLKFSPTDRLHLSLDGQYVKSNVLNVDDAINMNTFADVSIDLRGKYPQVSFVTPGYDPAEYFQNTSYYRSAVENRSVSDGHEYALRGDLSYDFPEDSFLQEVRVGGRYADRSQTQRTNDFNNWGSLSDTYLDGGVSFVNSYPNLSSPYYYPDFFHGDTTAPLTTNFINPSILMDHQKLMDLARQVRTPAGGFTPIEDRGSDLIDGYFQPNEIYPNSETTYSGYAMVKFGHPLGGDLKLSGNLGVRFVRTIDKSTGGITFPNADQVLPSSFASFADYCASAQGDPANPVPALCKPGVTAEQQQQALAFANGGSAANVARNAFNNWLPSLNLRLDVTPKLLFRFAASKAISRPDFSQLRNYVGLQYNNLTGGFTAQSQNPYLRPVEAWQFDLTGEWYFAPVGSLTVALFAKNLKNVIVSNQLYTRQLTNNGATNDVTVSGPGNSTGKTTVKGAEFAYQQTFDFLPGPLAGLGAQLSYTFIDVGKIAIGPPGYAPSVDFRETGNQPTIDITGLYDNLPLEGLSKHNINAVVFYERSGFQARLAYSWRSRFLLTRLDCCFPFGPVYQEPSGQMDGSFFYSVNKHFQIGLEVQNLLDATVKTSFALNGDGLRTPRSWFKNDRQFALTTRINF